MDRKWENPGRPLNKLADSIKWLRQCFIWPGHINDKKRKDNAYEADYEATTNMAMTSQAIFFQKIVEDSRIPQFLWVASWHGDSIYDCMSRARALMQKTHPKANVFDIQFWEYDRQTFNRISFWVHDSSRLLTKCFLFFHCLVQVSWFLPVWSFQDVLKRQRIAWWHNLSWIEMFSAENVCFPTLISDGDEMYFLLDCGESYFVDRLKREQTHLLHQLIISL